MHASWGTVLTPSLELYLVTPGIQGFSEDGDVGVYHQTNSGSRDVRSDELDPVFRHGLVLFPGAHRELYF